MKENLLLNKIANKMIEKHMYHDSTIVSRALCSKSIEFKHKIIAKYEMLLYMA